MRPLLKRLRSRLLLPFTPRIVRRVRAEALTFLGPEALVDLFKTVRAYERHRAPGMLIEAGCAAGGSAIVIAAAKQPERLFQVYDVFGMIPPPGAQDDTREHERYAVIREGRAAGIGERKYYGYEDDLLSQVTASFTRHGFPAPKNNVHLIKGLFQDTMQIDQPVLLAHLDGDWYESVMTCLQRIAPHLVPGGRFVIDDYFSWAGCRRAVDEYFADKRHEFVFVRKTRLHIVRK